MTRSDAPPGPARLAAVLGPPVSGDPPTEPIPVVSPPRARRFPAMLSGLVPRAWRGARVDPGRPGATALVLVAVVAAVLAAVGVWTERPQSAAAPALPVVAVSDPGAAATTGPAAPLVVSVSGKVHRPGLVRVPAGSRVADVLDAAGGALPGTDLTGLNLARRVGDGEQVAVGAPAAPDAAPGGPPAGAGLDAGPAAGAASPAARIDLNSASAAQLDTLPGIGPVTVAHIVDWRTRNGRFARVEQLREIEGIGERRFAQLKDLVTVS